MVGKVIATCRRNSMELMIREMGKSIPGGFKGIEEKIVRIVHLVCSESGTKAALIKRTVMGHEWQTSNKWFHLCPHLIEHWGILCVLSCQTMNVGTYSVEIIGFRMNERIECIVNLSVPDNYDSHRTNTASLEISCFKIYCRKVSH